MIQNDSLSANHTGDDRPLEHSVATTELVKVQNLCTWVKVQVTQKKATQVEVKVLNKNCTSSTIKK